LATKPPTKRPIAKPPAKKPAVKRRRVVRKAPEKTPVEKARDWIDLAAYAGGKLVKGVLPITVGCIGGLELFAPGVLNGVELNNTISTAMLTGGLGMVLPGFWTKGPSDHG
jgi:hypothetical protein